MHGVRVASAVVGIVVVFTAAIVALVVASIYLLGPVWGGVVSLGVVLVGMFILIAVEENRSGR